MRLRATIMSKRFSGTNTGDCMQSLAAHRLAGGTDIYLVRDNLSHPFPPCKALMCGYHGWDEADVKAWPPNHNLDMLVIGFHAARLQGVEPAVISRNLEWWKSRNYIGCRDTETVALFREYGIEAEFSGCVTMTLEKPEISGSSNPVILADVFPPQGLECKSLTQNLNSASMTQRARLDYAAERLSVLATAKCVITTRLHTALPCAAMDIPCMLIAPPGNPNWRHRFSGLSDFVTFSDKIQGDHIVDFVNNPIPNPNRDMFRRMADGIREAARQFYAQD